MKGAKVTQIEQADLVRGNGPHEGYCIMDDGRNQTFTRWEGMVTTVMKEGQPLTNFEGTWRTIDGTGKYAGGYEENEIVVLSSDYVVSCIEEMLPHVSLLAQIGSEKYHRLAIEHLEAS
jgi:hypothetical protein